MLGGVSLAMKTLYLNTDRDSEITITVCVGSSCHLKGSYEIIQFLKELIKSSNLGHKVTLKGSFCMERCTEGVNVKINEEMFSVGSVARMKEIFQDKVVSTLHNQKPADQMWRYYGKNVDPNY